MSLPIPAEEPFTSPVPASTGRPTLRASGPGEIVQVIPFLLGFHPESSAVVLALRGREVVVSARVDLDAPVELLAPLVRSAVGAGASGALLVIYDESITGHPLPYGEYRDRFLELLAEQDLDEVDSLAVGSARWWSYRCTDPGCCPMDGTEIEPLGALATEAVAEGLVALSSRQAVEAELAPDRSRVAEVGEALRELGRREDARPMVVTRAAAWADVRRFVRQARRGVRRPSPEECAKALIALQDLAVRDAALGLLRPRPEPEVELAWRDLTRSAPPGWRAPVATIYAVWCYASGQGARANIAIDHALMDDPGYSMALILEEALRLGVSPHGFVDEVADVCREIGRTIQRKTSI